MPWQYSPYFIPLVLAGTLTAILAAIGFSRRSVRGAGPFALYLAAATIWILGYAGEFASADLAGQVAAIRIEYLGIVLVPVSWLLFVLECTGHERWFDSSRLPFLGVIPFLTVVMVWTNDLHHLFYTGVNLVSIDGFLFRDLEYGPFFWVHGAWAYACFFAGVALLVAHVRRTRTDSRRRASLLLEAGLLPLAFVTAYLARPVSPVELDLTPFTFVFTGLAVMVVLLRNPLFDLMPVAYSRVVDSMADGVVVLDPDLRVVGLNPAAGRLAGTDARAALGRPAAEVLPCVGDLIAEACCSGRGRSVPARLTVGGVPCHFELRCQPVEGRRGRRAGWLVTLIDLQEQVLAREQLEQANRKLSLLSSLTRHDISNRLTALLGELALVREEPPGSPELPRRYDRLEASAAAIERQLAFARIYQDLGSAEAGWQRLADRIQRAVEDVPHGSVRIECAVGETEVFADPLLERVFANLVENAVRYGRHLTRVRFSTVPGPEGSLLVVCEDDGVGVPLEEKERIFQQGVGANTGLGLFLVREVLAITGSSIRETGTPGRGGRFELLFPAGSHRSDSSDDRPCTGCGGAEAAAEGACAPGRSSDRVRRF